MLENRRIIDISQPVTSGSAHFPGDVPFSRTVTVSYQDSQVINLTALTMSPHIGTHADAPIHVFGDLAEQHDTAGLLPLAPYLGPAVVIDLSPWQGEINVKHVQQKLASFKQFPQRILFKTKQAINHEQFDDKCAFLGLELVELLSSHQVVLVGIDTPSVDEPNSKMLAAHHQLIASKIYWLENLDLSKVETGEYFLIALPIKFMELEASPVRAVLLESGQI